MEVIKFIQSFANPGLDRVFQLITVMGEDILFILVFTIVFWCVNKELGYRLGFSYLTGGVLNVGIKEIFQVPRPIGQPGIRSLRVETATGYSFPSGHTQNAATIWTSLMVHLKRGWLYVLGTAAILLVALSRLYLGVHWPTDVAAGAVIGVTWVFISNRIFDYLFKGGGRLILLLLVILVVMGGFIFKTADYFKVSGIVTSFILGYRIETRYIRFTVEGGLLKQLVKMVVGVGVLLCIKTLGKQLLPETLSSDFFRYFIMGIWVTVLAPWVFKITLNREKKIRRSMGV